MVQIKRKGKKFEDILNEELRKYIDVSYKDKKQRKALEQIIKDLILGKDSSKDAISIIPISERKRFLVDILWAYHEIFITLENMKMISVFVRQYPNYKSYKTQKITKTKYLRYHIENYLNEIYIFEKRVEAFLNKLIKKLKLKKLDKEIDKIIKLKDSLYKSLEKINSLRGAHIHKYRFTEKELDHLATLELFEDIRDFEIIGFYKDLGYKQVRIKWAKTINENNNALQELLDYILEEITPIVFGKLISCYRNGF